MKMIVAVVQDEHVPNLTDALTRKGFRATKLASTGGFWRAGNSTFLVGVPTEQLDEALATIRTACEGKRGGSAATGASQGGGATAQPGKTGAASAATVFVLDVQRMLKV